MVRPGGLNARVVGASLVLALVVAGAFVVMISGIQTLRSSSREAQHSEEVVSSANRLERLALDLETGQRGYVITGEPVFLQPYRRATAEFRPVTARLESLVADDPAQLAFARRIAAAIAEYRTAWAAPTIALARRDLGAARARVATGGGKRRMDAIRARFATFVATQERISAERSRNEDREGRRAIVLGIAALGGSALLVLVYAAYLSRLVTAPVRRVAEGARRIRTGALDTRVPDRGVGEIGALARDFNAMAAGLGEQREQLARQNVELQAVLDATLDGILMADTEGNVLFANRKMMRFWADLAMPDEGTIWDRMVRLARRTTTPDAYFDHFARIAADPREEVTADLQLAESGRSFVAYTAPVADSTGALVGRIFSIRDVTDVRESERVKSEFVATVSHELRTPLTSIVGYVEVLLAADELESTQRRYLEIVSRNAARLQRLVGDLLFFSQVESGGLRLEDAPVDLRDLCARALDAARPAGEAKQLAMELDAPEPVEVRGDAARLEQLLDNLLSNAVKFSEDEGRVSVRLRRDDGHAVVEVCDRGIGIPPDEIDNLFGRFFRASTATERLIPGTGLGLAIVRAIVEAHHGEIGIRSDGGVTVVTVRLPLGVAGSEGGHELPEAAAS